VSLLLSEGHVNASKYPLRFLWNEVSFAQERMASRARTEAIIMQAAILSAIDKEGSRHFKELLEKLDGN
jgi:hypothetical protein